MSQPGSRSPSPSAKMRDDRGGFVFESTPAVVGLATAAPVRRLPGVPGRPLAVPLPPDRCALRALRQLRPGLRQPGERGGAQLARHRPPRPVREPQGSRPVRRRTSTRCCCGSRRSTSAWRGAASAARCCSAGSSRSSGTRTRRARSASTSSRWTTRASAPCRASRGSTGPGPTSGPDVQLVILHETLEACSDPGALVGQLTSHLPPSAWVAVTYSNDYSFPARLLRRYWSELLRLQGGVLQHVEPGRADGALRVRADVAGARRGASHARVRAPAAGEGPAQGEGPGRARAVAGRASGPDRRPRRDLPAPRPAEGGEALDHLPVLQRGGLRRRRC